VTYIHTYIQNIYTHTGGKEMLNSFATKGGLKIVHGWLPENETDAIDEDLIRAIMRLLKELPV
jgi:hypothetical protein